jgi:ferredoxin-type protein NapH
MPSVVEKLGRDAIANKGWFGAHKWLILRRLSQIAILGLFMAGPLAGVWVLKGNLSSSLFLDKVPMTDPLVFLQMLAAGHWDVVSTAVTGAALVLAFYLLVGGRVYCAWVCPVNIVTDTAHWLRRKLGIKASARISHNARYWMLGLVLLLALATGSLAYELVNPVSMLHRGLIFGMGAGWALILGIFLFDLFVARHGWCGHLCPMGTFYGLVGAVSLIRVRADNRAVCDDCMECYEVCPEPQVIPPALKGERRGNKDASAAILFGDCSNCGRCIDICPHDVFNFGLRYPAAASARRPARLQGTARHEA